MGPASIVAGPFTCKALSFPFPFTENTGILVGTPEDALDSSELTGQVQAELDRRHKAAATTVAGFLIATIFLCLVSFIGKSFFRQQDNPPLDVTLRITILVLGLGSIAWRRTKFSTMRLKDIGALQGPSGLLSTLERTTLQIALLAAAIAAIGFVATLLTGNDFYTYGAGAVGVAVLLYCYPTKISWIRTIQLFGPKTDSTPAV